MRSHGARSKPRAKVFFDVSFHLRPIHTKRKSNGLFILHGTGNGTGNGKRWVSILHYVLYTLHKDRDRGTIVFYCVHPGPSPCPVIGSVQCV